MEKEEQKRIFLVVSEDEIPGLKPPKGVYFVRFLSSAQELWISEKMKETGSPYMLIARNMHLPIYTCRLKDGVPTIRPRRERAMEKAYEM